MNRDPIGNRWTPKHGIAFNVGMAVCVAIISVGLFLWSVRAFGQQEIAPPATPIISAGPIYDVRDMNWREMIPAMLPALWACLAPVVIAMITKGVNQFANAYVPRSIQVMLSGILGAIAATLGDASAGATAMAGMATQTYAAVNPDKFLTTAPLPAEDK